MDTAKSFITNLFGVNGHNARCEVCGNEYDHCFEIHMHGETHVFDSFECAIHALAPRCAHCDCPIVGHGIEVDGVSYCCAHCARENGVHILSDPYMSERSPA